MAQRQYRSDDTDTWNDKYGNGGAGALTINTNTTYSEANASCTGSAAGTSLTLGAASTFANGDLVIIHQTQGSGVDNWELNKISSGAGTTSLTMTYNLMNTYSAGAQIIRIKPYTNVTINSGVTLLSQGWGGNTGGIVAYLAKNSITVNGHINNNGGSGIQANPDNTGGATGGGFRGANGRTQVAANQGEGTAATGSASTSANGNGGGGGGGSSTQSSGGSGSNGSAGSSGGGTSPGSAGSTVGSSDLTTIALGGGGGGAQDNVNFGSGGGSGGGIIILIAPTITFTDTTSANGGAGLNTGAVGINSGAGSGGSILLKCQDAILGTNLVTASGGGISGGSGAGGDGRIHIDYSDAVTGTTIPTATTRLDSILKVSIPLRLSENITLTSRAHKSPSIKLSDQFKLSSTLAGLKKNLVTWIKQPRPLVD